MKRTIGHFIGLVSILLSCGVGAEKPQDYGVSEGNEELLLSGLKNLQSHELDSALKDLKELTERRPDFRLAQLVYADLLAAQASGQPLRDFGDRRYQQKKIDGMISEARARLLMELEKPAQNQVPEDLLSLAPSQRHVVVVDTRLSRLFLFENRDGEPYLIKDFYASYGRAGTGKERQGDLKTPLGVYFITGRLLDETLPSKYGSGALPLNYPNAWDQRLGRTGNGIWVHGSPVETYSRPPQASEGCISLTNPDFINLDQTINFKNTPVIVGENIRWIERKAWRSQRSSYLALLQKWEKDWESLDHERYIGNYSKSFHDGKRNYSQFDRYKTRVNGNKSFVDVNLADISLYRYPDDPGLMVATFSQGYRSNDLSGTWVKRQYWRFEQGKWRIAYEGSPQRGNP